MVEVELHVSDRLKKLLPALSEEEQQQLQANIKGDGRVTDPILYWWDGKRNVVLDGMHRLEIAKKGGFPYRAEPIEPGPTYQDAEIWVLNRALGQRNLLRPEALRKVRAELYEAIKGAQGGDRKSKCHNDTLIGDAASQVAERAGVTRRTVFRDAARLDLLKRCTPSVRRGVDTGAFAATDAEIKTLAGLPEAQQDLVATALRKKQAASVKAAMASLKIKAGPAKKPKPISARSETAPAFHAREQIKVWAEAIGRWLATIDEYRDKWPGWKGDEVVKLATGLYEALNLWGKEIK